MGRRRRVARVEGLESRRLLATFTVTSAADFVSSNNLTLREAILLANDESVNPGPDVIEFNIPDSVPPSGSLVRRIELNADLPPITAPVAIRGATQPGYAGTPLIQLERSSDSSATVGFDVLSPGVSIDAFAIVEFLTIAGIRVSQGGQLTLTASYVGLDAAGGAGFGNGFGVILASPGNRIGGTTAGAGNVISGNSFGGIDLTGAAASSNLIAGNRIGTDVAGTADLGNNGLGVSITSGTGNTIGGTVAGARNIISGNEAPGIGLSGGSSGNLIQGNYIGTDVTGTADLGNSATGVFIADGNDNTIGGTAAGARNVISGNGAAGVGLAGASSGNLVEGNYIGTDVTGTADLGNTGSGVDISTATGNTIGGTAAGAGNVISGNDGVGVSTDRASGNLIQGNYIGTDAAGTASLGNTASGVSIDAGGDNTIGGTAAGARNVVSGNGAGIRLSGASSGNLIQGNYIGTDVTGTADLGNIGSGVLVADGRGNTIGGAAAGARNVISGNGFAGVSIVGATSTGNAIQGNRIGTNAAGTAAVANAFDGINIGFVSGSGEATPNGNTVGGPGAEGNLISGNGRYGVVITALNGGGADHLIQGNVIGLNAAGDAALPNADDGIVLSSSGSTFPGSASNNRVLGNTISGNGDDGIQIEFATATGNLVQGNRIGTNVAGTAPIGNVSNGVRIFGSPGNQIGGTGAGAGNLITGNGQNGVAVIGPGSIGNTILSNSITQNGALGIDYDPPAGPGGGPAFPVLTFTEYEGTALTVEGTLNAPAGTYRVEIFSDPGDPSGYGEGATFLGFTTVTISSTGATPFRAVLQVPAFPAGVITATATSSSEGTSEFSRGVAAEPTSFTVINTNDAGRGSLRQAILNANRVPGRQLIDFRIPSSYLQNGCYIIQPSTELPFITEAVDLDATTQPGYADRPVVELRGGRVAPDPEFPGPADGLTVVANDVRIAGLAINRFTGAGIRVEGTVDGPARFPVLRSVLEGLYVGTDCTGQAAPGNAGGGIVLAVAADGRVGGLNPGLRNLVSGNGGPGGIVLQGGSTRFRIVNNFIGTDATGRRVIGTQAVGIGLANATENQVGVPGSLGRNLIAGNDVGVRIQGAGSTSNLVRNNSIGTDDAGRSGLGNAIGVHIVDAGRNTIGGAAGLGNVLSGNSIVGLRIDGAGATGNTILGNRIGTDLAGRRAVPNGFDGVFVLAPGNRIVGNIVSGNASTGIQLFGPNARGNTVEANFVGTDVSGTRPLGNRRDGIYINGASNNTIRNNVVSANGSTGVQLFGTNASGNVVANNRIGTNAAGRVVRGLGNRFGLFLNGAGTNRIGGADGANRINGNTNAAIFTSIAATAPIVEGVQGELVAGRLVAVTLTFSRDMDVPSTTNLANYRLRTAAGTDLAIASARYDADRRTVTLALAAPLANPADTQVAINASSPRGVRGRTGLLLDGNRDGRPGSDFAAVVPA